MTKPDQAPSLAERIAAAHSERFRGSQPTVGELRLRRIIESELARSPELTAVRAALEESLEIDKCFVSYPWTKKDCQCDPDVGAVPCPYCDSHRSIDVRIKALASLTAITGEAKP